MLSSAYRIVELVEDDEGVVVGVVTEEVLLPPGTCPAYDLGLLTEGQLREETPETAEVVWSRIVDRDLLDAWSSRGFNPFDDPTWLDDPGDEVAALYLRLLEPIEDQGRVYFSIGVSENGIWLAETTLERDDDPGKWCPACCLTQQIICTFFKRIPIIGWLICGTVDCYDCAASCRNECPPVDERDNPCHSCGDICGGSGILCHFMPHASCG